MQPAKVFVALGCFSSL